MRDDKPSRVTSRSEKVSKKRKVNNIYNILLGVVIVLIIIVGASIFLNSKDDETAAPNDKTANHENDNKADKEKDKTTDDSKAEDKNDDASNDDKSVNEDDEATNEDEDQTEGSDEMKKPSAEDEIVENSGDSAVAETKVNSSWEPVGTEQTGEHVTKFDDTSSDWKEMEKALAYGSGIEHSNMTVHWLGNGGAPNKAVGTVAAKGDSTKYKVYIEWVDGQGWKPTKVEKLK